MLLHVDWFQRKCLPVCERELEGFSLLLFPSFGRISSAHDTSDHCLADDFATCRYAAAAATAAGGNANFIATFGFAAAAGSNFPAIEPASREFMLAPAISRRIEVSFRCAGTHCRPEAPKAHDLCERSASCFGAT